MIKIAVALGFIAIVLLFVEWLWRQRLLKREAARKIIHVIIGSWVAFWPFFLSFETIQALALVMFLVTLISWQLKVFKAIHMVKRRTIGEILFAVSIGLCALLTATPWIFAVAILELGLADGLAAIVGGRAQKYTYKISGQPKSLLGSLVFLLASVLIVGVAVYSQNLPIISLAVVPVAATLAEFFSPYGVDDLSVPLITLWLLSVFS